MILITFVHILTNSMACIFLFTRTRGALYTEAKYYVRCLIQHNGTERLLWVGEMTAIVFTYISTHLGGLPTVVGLKWCRPTSLIAV